MHLPHGEDQRQQTVQTTSNPDKFWSMAQHDIHLTDMAVVDKQCLEHENGELEFNYRMCWPGNQCIFLRTGVMCLCHHVCMISLTAAFCSDCSC